MEKPVQQSNGGQILIAVLIGTIGSGLLFSASLAVPLVGFVSAFLAPVPLGLARIRGGSVAAGFSALLTTLLMAILFSPPVGAWYAVQCGMIGLMIPELTLKGVRSSRSILWTTATTVVLTALLVAVYSFSSGTSPQLFAQKEITDSMNQAVKLYEQQSGLSPQDLEAIKQGMQSIGQLISRIYPALATINLGLISTIYLLVFNRMAIRRSLVVSQSPFKEFRTPDLLVWFLIAAGFAMLAPTPLVTTPALNLLALLVVVYFAQGLAVVLTFCDRTSFASSLKVMLAILLLTQPYMNVIITVIGVFDYWGEFRTPRTTQEENL
jgi:uncharacterized protein YybS (DUF2232 family)